MIGKDYFSFEWEAVEQKYLFKERPKEKKLEDERVFKNNSFQNAQIKKKGHEHTKHECYNVKMEEKR